MLRLGVQYSAKGKILSVVSDRRSRQGFDKTVIFLNASRPAFLPSKSAFYQFAIRVLPIKVRSLPLRRVFRTLLPV